MWLGVETGRAPGNQPTDELRFADKAFCLSGFRRALATSQCCQWTIPHTSANEQARLLAELDPSKNSDLLRFLLLFASGWAGNLSQFPTFYNVLRCLYVAAILAILMDFPVSHLSKTHAPDGWPSWRPVLAVAALNSGLYCDSLGFRSSTSAVHFVRTF